MSEAVSRAGSSRHVVFPDGAGGYGRALDLTPRPAPAAVAPPSAGSPARAALPEESESFLRWLFSRVGLRFGAYKAETLGRRLPACLRAVRATSTAQARSILHRNPELVWTALGALVIGVTWFFRDKSVFQALHQRVLPELLRRHRHSAGARPLRVWSAGCSDGAELYTVALLLAELGALSPGRCELLGTDCRPEALESAAAGVYGAAAVKGVPAAMLRRYFRFDGSYYRVRGELTAAVRWRRADTLAAVEPGPWDLVLCRNFAIYLQPEATVELWAQLAGVLTTGGILVLGKAERPLGVRELVSVGPCIYQCQREAAGP
jgi:chemotaxis protein methyltransferase CheR